MKFVTPLDRNSLIEIPTALEGKFYLGGPYELVELLQEPEVYGDEDIDWRKIQIIDTNGAPMRSVQVDVACSHCHANSSVCPGFPTEVTQKIRYIYREKYNATIEGAVILEVTYQIKGVREKFSVESKKVIHSVYVKASSRGRGIARILLAEVVSDAPDVKVHPQFSEDGARLFGFDKHGKRSGAAVP